MKVKRVLHVTSCMNKGGMETFIMNVYRNIDHTKLQFDFLISVPEICDYEEEILELGGRVYRTIPKTQGLLKYISNTNKILLEMPQYDAVHIHVSSLTSALGWLLTKVRKIPVKLFHSHNTKSKRDLKGILRKLGQIILSRNSDYLLACSKAAGTWLYNSSNKPIIVVNNGVDTERFFQNPNVRMESRENLNIKGKFVIGHIGRFNEQKNHEFLIEIFREIYEKDKNAVLLLIGKGQLEPVIHQKVQTLGLEGAVMFLGLRDDINSLLNGMDVFLLPSLYEGLPVVGIEAQATGVKSFMSETITKEVDITGLINFISLEKSASFWASEIIKSRTYERFNTKDQVIKSGFEIKEVAARLSSLYLQRDK